MGKFGKKKVVKKGMENFMIGVMGPSGFGKSTLMYQVCDKKFGEDGYIILDVGSERGMEAIDGVITERVPTWKNLKEVIDDIVKNKESDYPELKVIVLDTLDATFELAEQATVAAYNREHMGEQNFRPAASINAVEGGFGRGLDRVIETVKKEINRLNNVGVGVWWTSHVKERDQTDLFTGSSYTQLTASMSMKYFNSIKDISHIISFGYYDRSIQTIEVGEVNPVTKKKKTRKDVSSETRKLKFRDDSLVADAKSRFSGIVDEINLDADEFIEAVEDAIKNASSANTSKKTAKKITKKSNPVEELIEEEDNIPFDVDEDAKAEAETSAEDEVGDIEEDIFAEEESPDDDFDVEAALPAIRAAFKSADAPTKKTIKAILVEAGDGKLNPSLPVGVLKNIMSILGI